ncbi:MAG: hypothetical protein M5R41_03435 [Bacteroidia bacterium]|nr:hypothetical protein [Bacteroidia bacterium]
MSDTGPERWQRKMLPVMNGMLIGLTVFFFAASLFQLYRLQDRIEAAPTLDLSGTLGEAPVETDEEITIQTLRWRTLAMLESNTLARRYHQANVSLMSRIWTRYLGFVTGMIMVLVGCAFVLGKLQGPETNIAVEAKESVKLSVISASPGMLLAVLGTVLMMITIIVHTEISVNDGSVYTPEWHMLRDAELDPPPGDAAGEGGDTISPELLQRLKEQQ